MPKLPAIALTPPSDQDDLYTLRAGLDHELGERTNLQFATGYQTRQGTSGGTGDYDEFWASVQVIRTFGTPAGPGASGPGRVAYIPSSVE